MKKHLVVLCLLAAALAPFASAATVTINYYGTFGSGSWDSSGSENVFGVGTNLAGLPFQLTVTINDSAATQTASNCTDNDAFYQSKASGSNASAITGMTLTAWNSSGVQGNTFTFANNYPLSSAAWEVDRYGPGYYSGGSVDCNNLSYSGLMLSYSENYGGGIYTGTSNVGGPGSWVYTTSALSTADWRAAVASAGTPAAIYSSEYYGFNIHVAASGTTTQYAGGYLQPSAASSPFVNGVYVSGPPSDCDIPISEGSTAYNGWTGTYASYYGTLYDINTNNTSNFNNSSSVIQELYGSGSGVQQGTDTCYSQYIANYPTNPLAIAPIQYIPAAGTHTWTIGQYPMGNNQYGYDLIGWGTTLKGDYRGTYGTLPCSLTVYQQMQYYCSANTTWYAYGSGNSGSTNTITATIDSTQLEGTRATATATPSNQ